MPGIMSELLFQFLIPGVQHGEEADLGPEPFGVTRDFDECLRGSAE